MAVYVCRHTTPIRPRRMHKYESPSYLATPIQQYSLLLCRAQTHYNLLGMLKTACMRAGWHYCCSPNPFGEQYLERIPLPRVALARCLRTACSGTGRRVSGVDVAQPFALPKQTGVIRRHQATLSSATHLDGSGVVREVRFGAGLPFQTPLHGRELAQICARVALSPCKSVP